MRPKQRKNNNTPDNTTMIPNTGIQRQRLCEGGYLDKEVISRGSRTKFKKALLDFNNELASTTTATLIFPLLTKLHQEFYDMEHQDLNLANNQEFEIWALRDIAIEQTSAADTATVWSISAAQTSGFVPGDTIVLSGGAGTTHNVVCVGPNDNIYSYDPSTKTVTFNYPGEFTLRFFNVFDQSEETKTITFTVKELDPTRSTL